MEIHNSIFTDDSQGILTWGTDSHFVNIWRIKDDLHINGRINHQETLEGIRLSKKGHILISWGQDKELKFWYPKDGLGAAMPVIFDIPLEGAFFIHNDQNIVTWNNNGITVWDVTADYDFPIDYVKNFVEVTNGTQIDEYNILKTLTEKEWDKKRDIYKGIAESHLEKCLFREFNYYEMQKKLWED
jgi:hypothetical protein